MENNILNIDFESMSEQQLELIEEKSKEYRKKTLDRRVAELENWKKQAMTEIKLLDDDNKQLKENAKKVDYLTDEYKKLKNHTDKFKILKHEVKSRASVFFAKRDTNELQYVEYILFYDSYISATSGKEGIYGKLNEAFNVGSSGEIYEEDLAAAITVIKRWTPSPRFRFKLLEYRRKQVELAINKPNVRRSDKFLEKQRAYERYLELTDGGMNNAI